MIKKFGKRTINKNKHEFFILALEMAQAQLDLANKLDEHESTTTSESSDSASETEEVRQTVDGDTSREESDEDEVKPAREAKEENPPPKRKRQPSRKLELPKFAGHIMHFEGLTDEEAEKVVSDFKIASAFAHDRTNMQCTIINTDTIKRIPTQEEKDEFVKETRRLAKLRNEALGIVKKPLTEKEKEARRRRNESPEVLLRKSEAAKIKRQIFNDHPELVKKYKKEVEKKLGRAERKKRPRKDSDGAKTPQKKRKLNVSQNGDL